MQLLQFQDCSRGKVRRPTSTCPRVRRQYIAGYAMQIENEFQVAASPERVYAFLLDVNRVVTCMPGAELSEVVDPTTFKGRVRIKVGPITVAYNGTARIADRDDVGRVAVLEAEGRETTGPGSAR